MTFLPVVTWHPCDYFHEVQSTWRGGLAIAYDVRWYKLYLAVHTIPAEDGSARRLLVVDRYGAVYKINTTTQYWGDEILSRRLERYRGMRHGLGKSPSDCTVHARIPVFRCKQLFFEAGPDLCPRLRNPSLRTCYMRQLLQLAGTRDRESRPIEKSATRYHSGLTSMHRPYG